MTDKEFKRLSRAQLIDNFSVNVNAFDLITGYRGTIRILIMLNRS